MCVRVRVRESVCECVREKVVMFFWMSCWSHVCEREETFEMQDIRRERGGGGKERERAGESAVIFLWIFSWCREKVCASVCVREKEKEREERERDGEKKIEREIKTKRKCCDEIQLLE